MESTAIRRFSATDYRAMEDDGHRYEVINGELIMAPAPNRFHQVISGNLHGMLHPFLRKHRLGKVYAAPLDVFLDELNVVQPDLVFIAKDSQAKEAAEGIHGAPDLVVEILSAGTSRRDLRDKRELYTRFGATEYWVVVPETRQVQVYLLKQNPTRPTHIHEEIDTFETALIPGLKIAVAEVFEEF